MTPEEYALAVQVWNKLRNTHRILGPEHLENQMLELTAKALKVVYSLYSRSADSVENPPIDHTDR